MLNKTQIIETVRARYATNGGRCRVNQIVQVPAGQLVMFTRWYQGVFAGDKDVSENRCAYFRNADNQLVFDMITE